MIEAIDLCRELQDALESNSEINRRTGGFTTYVDPTFFARLKAVCQGEKAELPNVQRSTSNAQLSTSKEGA